MRHLTGRASLPVSRIGQALRPTLRYAERDPRIPTDVQIRNIVARPVTRTTPLGTSGSSYQQKVSTYRRSGRPACSTCVFQPSVGSPGLLRPLQPLSAKPLESLNRLRMSPTSTSPLFYHRIMWYRLHRGSLPSNALLDVSSENFLHNAPKD